MTCPAPPARVRALRATSELEQARRAHRAREIWLPAVVALGGAVATALVLVALLAG